MIFLIMLIIARSSYLTQEPPCERMRDEDEQRSDYYADGAPVDWGICPVGEKR